jgi:hypothetical protein
MATTIDGSTGITVPSGAIYNGIASSTAVASTSGTSIDFTSIPSWVKRITVMFNGVSTSGTSLVQVQLGSSGGITNTGYAGITQSSGASQASSAGFILDTSGGAAFVRYGAVILTNITANTWSIMGTVGALTTFTAAIGGAVGLPNVLTTVRLTTVNGTDTFDAGSINILYE